MPKPSKSMKTTRKTIRSAAPRRLYLLFGDRLIVGHGDFRRGNGERITNCGPSPASPYRLKNETRFLSGLHAMSIPEATRPAFLIVDTESIPDGDLLARVRYAADNLSPEDAIGRAQEEARLASKTGSDFVNVAFHIPVAVCVVKVANDFSLQAITCLDAPNYRPKEIVRKFWLGVGMYESPNSSRSTAAASICRCSNWPRSATG